MKFRVDEIQGQLVNYIYYRGPRAGQSVDLETNALHYYEDGERYLVYDGGLLLHSPAATSADDQPRDFRFMNEAVERAARELPDGWSIRVTMKSGSGTVELSDPEGNSIPVRSDEGLAYEVLAAIQISAASPDMLLEPERQEQRSG